MSITQYKKELLIKFKDYKCENCGNEFKIEDFDIHRIKRKGSYEDYRSLMVLCRFCHKRIHSNEWNHVRSK